MTTRRTFLIGASVACALLAWLSTPALAADTRAQWGLPSEVSLMQTNQSRGSQGTRLTVRQTGNQFSGQGQHSYAADRPSGYGFSTSTGRSSKGPVVGTVSGSSFEATIYWDNKSIGVYTGQIGPQGLLVGRTYDKTDPAAVADFYSSKPLECLATSQSAPVPGAAPTKPTLALGRVHAPVGTPPSPPKTLCESAASARARNSPVAPRLEERCKQYLAAHPVATAPTPPPSNDPPTPNPPVTAPQDLLIGRLLYKQDGKLVAQPVVGVPVEITCTYVVNEVVGPFVFKIQPWRGHIYIGGRAPETLMFQGDRHGGQHEARQLWTPSAAGRTPISCVLNAGFESLEANGRNNRWDETVDVAQAPSGASSPLGAVPVARSVPLQLTAPAPASLSAAAGKGNAVALKQPMLLPNATAMQSPAAKPANKGAAVSLNPQPLPPASPLLLPNQAPSPLR